MKELKKILIDKNYYLNQDIILTDSISKKCTYMEQKMINLHMLRKKHSNSSTEEHWMTLIHTIEEIKE
jgi:hypothetical protein